MSTGTRAAVLELLPALLPDALPTMPAVDGLELPVPTDQVRSQLRQLVGSGQLDRFCQALAAVGNCARPVRLHGGSQRIDTATGEVLDSYASADAPLGVALVRCGNRRASVCPSCSRLYAGDMFQLIRAGISGGKTVPARVADNPLVFTTLTAPSFGPVHSRPGHGSGPARCRPWVRGPARCVHGRPRTCRRLHPEGDPLLGQPLCGDCYDYAGQIVWQWWAPDLWRRFTIALRRSVAAALGVPATRLYEHATVQYAKVAEYQRRGVVHFHALIRLDGPKTPDGFAAAPAGLDAGVLARLIHHAAAPVRLTVPGVDDPDPARVLGFGAQTDTRPVTAGRRTDDPDQNLSPGQVAGYLAKYATKSANDDTDDGDVDGQTETAHHRRLRATVQQLAARAEAADRGRGGEPGPYALLVRWQHMLGFRGHFATKSRRYSITLGALRRARRRAQRLIARHRSDGPPLDLAALEADLLADEDHETTLIIGHWTYAGTGWHNEAQHTLALAAAARARAREHHRDMARQRKETNQRLEERTT